MIGLGIAFPSQNVQLSSPSARGTVEVAKGEGRKGWSAKSDEHTTDPYLQGWENLLNGDENLLKLWGEFGGFGICLSLYSLFLLKSIKQNGNFGTHNQAAAQAKRNLRRRTNDRS